MNGYHPNGSGPSHNGPSTDQVQIPIGPTNQPRVLIRQLDNMNAVFNLSGVETGFANSLRRVIMADVPTICTCTSS
jgi:DNA-directed RNA polymerase II subunit RPB3